MQPCQVREDHGMYSDASGNPTYKIDPDGTLGCHVFLGCRRYNGGCETRHTFDGSGPSFAPDLATSLKKFSYEDFQNIVVNGKQSVNAAQSLVMPSWGTNKNVSGRYLCPSPCKVGRSLGPGRPVKRRPKPAAATDACGRRWPLIQTIIDHCSAIPL